MPRSLSPLRSRYPPYIIHNTSYILSRHLPRHTSPLCPGAFSRRNGRSGLRLRGHISSTIAYLVPHGIIPRLSPPRALARISAPRLAIHPTPRASAAHYAPHTRLHNISGLSFNKVYFVRLCSIVSLFQCGVRYSHICFYSLSLQ